MVRRTFLVVAVLVGCASPSRSATDGKPPGGCEEPCDPDRDRCAANTPAPNGPEVALAGCAESHPGRSAPPTMALVALFTAVAALLVGNLWLMSVVVTLIRRRR